MTFTSLIFLFGFLPVTLFIYAFLPSNTVKNIFLLILSLLFYAWDNPTYLVLLLLSIAWNYISGRSFVAETDEKKKKINFIIAVAVNLIILGFFKYTNFLIDIINIFPLHIEHLPIHLPIGLSFFTFSAISYLADVYTGKTKVQKSILKLGLYISFFGKVNMGPIVQYHDMEEQLDHHPLHRKELRTGVILFLKGVFKKVLIADRLALVFGAMTNEISILGAWMYAISYMLQLYFDFSGYSDMAIGLSRMFGFSFEPNFDHPYMAVNAQDFWRRWHISLSRWFRDYVYIPLGGNRVSTRKYIRNIFVVWFLTGLWHGANWTFIVWGLYYGCILLLEKFWLRKQLSKCPKFIQHIYALFIILIGWVFFMSPNISHAFSTIGYMFGLHASQAASGQSLFYLKTYLLLFIVAVLFSTPIYKYVVRFDVVVFRKRAGMVGTIAYLFLFLISISYILSSTFQSFLYFAF